jgi:fructose-1-phosphate kinase PfkB-like protein
MSDIGLGWVTDQKMTKFYADGVLIDAIGKGLTGTATIASGGTSVTCTHVLGAVPKVFLELLTNLGGRSVWISNKSETQFTINISSAAATDYEFSYRLSP